MAVTLSVSNGPYLLEGIQLRERLLTPKWFGRFALWVLFHRTDTRTEIVITGLTGYPR